MATPLRRDRRFVLLLGARVISVLGNGFARVALGFAVLALPDTSAGRLSLVLACQAVPQLAFILPGGERREAEGAGRQMIEGAADLAILLQHPENGRPPERPPTAHPLGPRQPHDVLSGPPSQKPPGTSEEVFDIFGEIPAT